MRGLTCYAKLNKESLIMPTALHLTGFTVTVTLLS